MTPTGEGQPVAARSAAASTQSSLAPSSGLRIELLSASKLPVRCGGKQPQALAGLRFAGPSLATQNVVLEDGLITVPLAPLETDVAEAWCSDRPVERLIDRGITLADDGQLLFGSLSIPNAHTDDLEAITRAAYIDLLSLCADRGYLHLLRCWNVVPQINAERLGLERYKLFCKGRAEGYATHFGEPAMDAFLPASSAVGGHGNSLVVQFIASREPGRHVENPRQVAAYRYPPQYGPKSPSFARATVAPPTAGSLIFISGTASIVGHKSLHEGDLGAQLDETLRNIRVLIEEIDDAPLSEASLASRLAMLRVYLRSGADWPLLRETLRERLGDHVPLIAVAADICRTELLVEIEGVARAR
jgi:chorismate lyase/3-hydroxybenzoate synthase